MTVSGAFSNIIKCIKPQRIYFEDNKFMVLLVDFGILYRFLIGAVNTKEYVVNTNNEKVGEIFHTLNFILKLLSCNIFPIIVFDGKKDEDPKDETRTESNNNKPVDLKEFTRKKRQHIKKKATTALRSLEKLT